MKLPLCYYGNPLLRKTCQPVDKITPEISKLVQDMIDTIMDSGNGVALAANQVGSLLRIFVIFPIVQNETGESVLGAPEVFINPVLSKPTEQQETMNEGCLSLPGLNLEVIRPYGIHVEAMNLEGEKVSCDVYGFKAREIMHENDHLNGKFFIDRVIDSVKKEIEPFLRDLKKKYSVKSKS